MQSASMKFTWLQGGFDAGDGKRGNIQSSSLDRQDFGYYGFHNFQEDLSIYRIDGKKLVSFFVIMLSEYPLNDKLITFM